MTPFASRALFLAIFAGAWLVAERAADACGYMGPTPEEATTFDQRIAEETPAANGEGDNDASDAESAFFGEQQADWSRYLGSSVDQEAWMGVLRSASIADVDALILSLQKGSPPPSAYASIAEADGATRERLKAALFFVGFLRRVDEQVHEVYGDESDELPDPTAVKKLLDGGTAAMRRATTPFMKQRYAYQLMRLQFYSRQWKDVIAFFDANTAVLDAPSNSLKWRARSYVAGAMLRSDQQRSRVYLELARIAAAYPALAHSSFIMFRPRSDKEWQDALKLATTKQDQTALWWMVGHLDPLAALEQLAVLDPTSKELAHLAADALVEGEYNAFELEGRRKDFARLQEIVLAAAATPGADRKWLLQLVAAHMAALDGRTDDALAALKLVEKAQKRPTAVVAAQMNATRAIALAHAVGSRRSVGDEMATLVTGLNESDFYQKPQVVLRVRSILQRSSDEAGKVLLVPRDGPLSPELLKAMLTRVEAAKTPYEKFVVADATATQVRQSLVESLIVRRRFSEARKYATDESSTLSSDPFYPWLNDCSSCEEPAIAGSWTMPQFTERLVELDRVAKGKDEAAAEASFNIGLALYATSQWGRARFYGNGETSNLNEARAALEKAYSLAKDREIRAQAAFMAAKVELANRIGLERRRRYMALEELPVPEKWFPIVRQYEDTKYYQQILAECGHYRRWSQLAKR